MNQINQLTEVTSMFNNIISATKQLGACNLFNIKPLEEWPDISDHYNIFELERQAALLTPEELRTVIDGEENEAWTIIESRCVKELNSFLADVFNGEYCETIPVPVVAHGFDRGFERNQNNEGDRVDNS